MNSLANSGAFSRRNRQLSHTSSCRRFVSLRKAVLFVAACAASTLFAAPTAAEFGTIINLAGRQRMLSQKLTKELLLTALEVDASFNLQNAVKTAEIFDKTLHGLRDGNKDLGLPATEDKDILSQLDKVTGLWNEYRTLVNEIAPSGKVTPEQAKRLAAINLPLLDEMNRCVTLYENQARGGSLSGNPALAIAVNLSGRQRMLSQKMTKEFCLLALGYEPEKTRLQLTETTKLFALTLKGLRNGDTALGLSSTINTPEIVQQLEVVNMQWIAYEKFMHAAIEGAPDALKVETIHEVADRCIPLLRDMNTVVTHYEALAH
jgi:hypothetical protein